MKFAALEERRLLVHEGQPEGRSLDFYKKDGGYGAAEKALKMKPADIIDMMKNSGLRGRGGAGFPTGLKWSFVPTVNDGPKYLLCNNDESEPGTFKDRHLCTVCPHLVIEGMIIAGFAVNATKGYIYTRYEFQEEIGYVEDAIAEAYKAGLLGKNIFGSGFDFDLDHYTGAGAYICGEETGLISSLEGKKGQPKLKPPFPAVSGYLGRPTVVNNTETLANVPWIINNGADEFKKMGTEKSTGTKLFSISGNIKKPGVYEVPMGIPFMDFLNQTCGGMLDGYKLKACIPGGASAPVLTAEELQNVTLDYESMAEAGTMLGSGAIMIIDDKQNMAELLKVILDFFAHESCGQCTPCREGTGWLANIMHGAMHGTASPDEIDKINSIAQFMAGKTICALSDAAAGPAISFVQKFGDEIKENLKNIAATHQQH